MTKQIYKFVTLAIVSLPFAITTLAYDKYQNSSFDLYEFLLATTENKVQIGDDVNVTLDLKNNDWQMVYCVIDRYHEFESYKFVLQKENGEIIVPLKNEKDPGIGSLVGFQINPLETFGMRLKISDHYKLGAGKYTLSVSKEILVGDNRTKIELASNKIEIEVAEATSNKSLERRR